MIAKIKTLLEKLIPEMRIPTANRSEILFSPSLSEIKKILNKVRGTSRDEVRFLVSKSGAYFVGDGNDWIHSWMAQELNLKLHECLAGGLRPDGYLWFYKYSLFDYLGNNNPDRVWMSDSEVKELFKSTDFYKLIHNFVNNIEYE